jgi:hypothetical protein
MKFHKPQTAFAVIMLLLVMAGFASASTQTLTGMITDDMCGRKHTMLPGKPDAECIRECVKAGSHYALLVGNKIYVMKGNAKQFDMFAGKKVKVSGDVSGTSITVNNIAAVK